MDYLITRDPLDYDEPNVYAEDEDYGREEEEEDGDYEDPDPAYAAGYAHASGYFD